MSAILHGLQVNAIKAQMDLVVRRDEEGKTTATRTFTIRAKDKQNAPIQAAFSRGATITSISSDLGAYWNFLELETHEMADQPGGMCFVYCTFVGYTESGDFDFDRETTYSLRGVLTERPIIEHPNYLAEVKDNGLDAEHAAIVGLYKGDAYVEDPEATNPTVRLRANDVVVITSMTDADALKWYTKIEIDGRRTYKAPTYEWTKAKANAGGLQSSDLADFGRKTTPDGNPPEPAGETGWWLYADLSEERSSNASSYSQTWQWQFGDVDADLYDY